MKIPFWWILSIFSNSQCHIANPTHRISMPHREAVEPVTWHVPFQHTWQKYLIVDLLRKNDR